MVDLPKNKFILFVIFYQLFLAIAFLIGGSIGKMMTQKMMGWFRHNPPYANSVTSAGNYPYYYNWKNLLLSVIKLRKPYLKGYRPSVPVVYMYAGKKPFQFHGQRWINYIEKNKENHYEIHEMQAGHWFMKNFPKFIT